MNIKTYNIENLELYNCRTGTDGYQAKYYADTRKHFIKTQAILSGVLMNDWQVEIIASDICKKLNIYHVEQNHCKVKNGSNILEAVISNNFEQEYYSFISFETLINKFEHTSTNESYFINMSTLDKLNYCASTISKITKISKNITTKYILDLAIIDILVGNTDRHTRNFGIFWDNKNKKYHIAKIFDNGMGLFENDYYRDNYKSINEKLRNTYIAPYGEDPFDMIDILKKSINISSVYNFETLKTSDYKFPSNDAKIYFKEALKRLRY